MSGTVQVVQIDTLGLTTSNASASFTSAMLLDVP